MAWAANACFGCQFQPQLLLLRLLLLLLLLLQE
jgi:hypothetical protein